MTTTNPGRAGDPTVQVDDGMVEAHARAVYALYTADTLLPEWDECRETVREDYCDEARLHLTALVAACEVREERRIVIDKPEVTGSWLPAALAGHDQRLAANWPSGRVERRLVIETPAEPVAPTGEEKNDG